MVEVEGIPRSCQDGGGAVGSWPSVVSSVKRTPFEINFRLLFVFYSQRLDFGLYLRISPKDWLRTFWSHPEADAIWYDVGPFAFFKTGVYSG